MKLPFAIYRDKLLGCWQGKCIGGTLGAPFEAKRQVNEDVDFYAQDLSGGPPMNDDLDLQLVWLAAVEEFGRAVDASVLADYWLHFIFPNWSEYGTGKANLRAGLEPPFSGAVGNPYGNSCGCFIRSEIWACLAPGHPELATRYAWEDAIVDHAGDGALCEVFTAAMQSAAFVEDDPQTLVDIALSYVPADCAVARTVGVARQCAAERIPLRETRRRIHDAAPGTFGIQAIRLRDVVSDGPDALQIGTPGFDAPENVAFAMAALLYHPDDFEKALLMANAFGEDTDCSCATLAATLGILQGASRLPEKWTRPLGNRIVTGCIDRTNLEMADIPNTVEELTDRILRVVPGFLGWRRVSFANAGGYDINCLEGDALLASDPGDHPQGITAIGIPAERSVSMADRIALGPNAIFKSFPTFGMAVDAQGEPFISPGEEKTVRVTLFLSLHIKRPLWTNVAVYAQPGLEVIGAPSRSVLLNDLWQHRVSFDFTLRTTAVPQHRHDVLFHVTMPGRATNATMKLVLLSR